MKILSFFPEISLMPHVQVVKMLIKYLIGTNLGTTLRLNFEKGISLSFEFERVLLIKKLVKEFKAFADHITLV